jgi:hypothetical protein
MHPGKTANLRHEWDLVADEAREPTKPTCEEYATQNQEAALPDITENVRISELEALLKTEREVTENLRADLLRLEVSIDEEEPEDDGCRGCYS